MDLELLFGNLSPITKKAYINYLNKLKKNFNTVDFEFIENYKSTIIYINKINLGNESKSKYLTSIITFINKSNLYKNTLIFYKEEALKLRNAINLQNIEKTNLTNKWNYFELKNFIDKIDPVEHPLECALLNLQFYYCHRSDLRSVLINDYDKNIDNYIDIKTKKIIYNYRNKNTPAITDNISIIWNKILPYINLIKNQKFLFNSISKKTQDGCSSNQFLLLLKKSFKNLNEPRFLNINNFRHIIASNPNTTLSEKISSAEILGHNLTSHLYYDRINPI